MKPLITKTYNKYIEFLRELVGRKSEFTNSEDRKKAIEYCKTVLEENLENHTTYFDEENNLIALPDEINTKKDIVYLSAHVDTVGAKAEEWTAPYHPWKVHEDKKELVGRGANDCKAGVAYELFLSFLAKQNLIKIENIVFTITFKEEGAGKKTAKEIAKNLGGALPVSEKMTYLIVLENNVKVADKPTLCIYSSERSNFVIEITDYIPQLQKHLSKLTQWNPASITPEKETQNTNLETITQTGGHMCSVSREQNKLTQEILNAYENSIIKAGDSKNFATVPTEIYKTREIEPIKHTMVLSNRSFDAIEDVLEQLKGIDYKEVKDFSSSQGFNIEKKFFKNKIANICDLCKAKAEIDLEYTFNIGGSDATTIYTNLDTELRKSIYPVVMGPGSRSQRKANPPRLTHGKNETFDKRSGEKVVIFISEVMKDLGTIQIP